MIRQRLVLLMLAGTLGACGGGGGGGPGPFVPDPCSVGAQKAFVRDVTNEWYLFPELLPAQVDISQFATAQDLLDAMTSTARAQGRDRYFSYVTTRQADSSFLQEGQFIGFGFQLRIDGARAYFAQAYESSPAAAAGITRGAELLAVDSGSGYVSVANLLPTDPNLSNALGPATEGVVRGLRFATAGAAPVEASLTKRVVTIQPIPDGGAMVLTLPSNPSVRVGYVNLRSYITTANAPLAAAFGNFAGQGIQNFVIDLRYNGGGLISVAEALGDLLGRLRQANDVYSHLRFRTSKSSNDATHFFNPRPESVDAVRIAFITTGGTASASELTVNSMKSWADVAIVGANTFGKPVGQSAFDLSSRCDTRLRLITFRNTNRDEEGDYYDGLAGTVPSCSAADDLSRPMGDPAEASTSAALNWLGGGACAPIAGVATARKPGLAAAIRYPIPERPSPAQVYLPGTF
jgi:C-terminal processing protease CtpA/Prc